jgi:hypothetical protein
VFSSVQHFKLTVRIVPLTCPAVSVWRLFKYLREWPLIGRAAFLCPGCLSAFRADWISGLFLSSLYRRKELSLRDLHSSPNLKSGICGTLPLRCLQSMLSYRYPCILIPIEFSVFVCRPTWYRQLSCAVEWICASTDRAT